MEQHERRARIYSITKEHTVEIFSALSRGATTLMLPRFEDVPPDADIRSVHFNYEADTFDFVIAHPSFEDVETGFALPRYPGLLLHEVVQITSPNHQPAPIAVVINDPLQ